MSRPSQRLTVALVTDGIHPFVIGGIQRHSRMLMEHLARQGVWVRVFHTAFSPATEAEARDPGWIPAGLRSLVASEFVDYPRRHRYPGHYLVEQHEYSRRCLARYLASGPRADFIYAQGLTGAAFLRSRLVRDAGTKVAVNSHGYEMFQRPSGMKSWLQAMMLRPAFRRINREADVVYCFSGKIRRIVEREIGVPASRVSEMPNAIDPEWISPAPGPTGPDRRFLFIGRLDRRKGLPELLSAAGGLPSTGWSLDVVGPVGEGVRNDDRRLRFHGAISESSALRSIIDRCDVLVCPSYSEGMPTVILEAMARGLAVVATDVGAVAELVDGRNGHLIGSPSTADISGAMRSLIEEPSSRIDEMKRESLSRSARYTWDAVTGRLIGDMRSRLARP